eukprot:11732597-Alexandrium_andersonii.AAC.1
MTEDQASQAPEERHHLVGVHSRARVRALGKAADGRARTSEIDGQAPQEARHLLPLQQGKLHSGLL